MNQPNKNNEAINLMGIVKTVTSKWLLFAISVLCCVSLAFFYSKISKDQYIVASNLLIRTDDASSGNMASSFMQQMGLGSFLGSSVSVDDELHIITSHSLMRETAREMGLNKLHILKESFFDRTAEYSGYAVDVIDINNTCDTLRVGLNFKVKINKDGLANIKVKGGFFKTYAQVEEAQLPVTINTIYGDYTVVTTPDYVAGEEYNYNVRLMGYDYMAEDLGENVNIYIPDKMSSMITLSIKTPYIEYGKELLNTICRLYNRRDINTKKIEAANTERFIKERLEIISSDLNNSEILVEEYKREHNLSDIEAELKAILENNVIFNRQIIETETRSKVIEHIIDFLSKPENKYELVPFSAGLDAGSANFIEEYNKLALNRINLLSSAKEGSPALSLLEKQIDVSRENVIISLHTAKANNDIALKELRNQEAKFDTRISSAPTQEREYISLYRQKAIKEKLYIFLLQKQEENALAMTTATSKGQIIDQAFTYNEPVNLSTLKLLIIGFIIGLIIPSVFLYLQYLFRTKFSDKEELESITNIPILAEICKSETKEHIVVKENSAAPISELFRLLRTNVQFMLNGKNDKVILLTSSISGEGKSFVSTNLSVSLSLLNKRTIIVGLDIRSPQLAENMSLRNQYGITNYLSSEDVNIDDLIIPSNINSQLDVILAGPIPPNPSELLLSQRLDQLFEELRNRYDYIIIDSAPVGMVSDTFSLTRLADTIIYVCRANYTPREYIRQCNTLVESKRLSNVSLVINATDQKSGYGYGYTSQNAPKTKTNTKHA